MTDDADERQPPLTLEHRSFTRARVEGKPCVVIYDAGTDKTTVLATTSRGYDSAIAAISLLELLAEPDPKLARFRALGQQLKKPKLIVPGTNASN